MATLKKINVLVIPDLFPKFPGDVQGVFILDYLKATSLYCNNTVLFLKIIGPFKGTKIEETEIANVLRYYLSSKKISPYLKPFYYLFLFFKGFQLGKWFKEVDVIHCHGTIFSGTLGYLLSKKLKVPFIITEHQGPFSMISDISWKKRWCKFIMQRADKLLVVSEHLKEEIINAGINPKLMQVTYNPVDTALFKLRQINDQDTIVFAGRLDNFKGALNCLKAFDEIDEEFPGWSFVIIGDGEDMYEIKRYLNGNPTLKNKVSLKGTLSKQEIAEIFLSTSFFVFPSKHESFGLVIAEALSCGVPVIAGNLTAPKEFVNNYNGLLVSPDSVTDIKDAMKTMIMTQKYYDSELIRSEIIEKFGFDEFGKSLSEIYRGVLPNDK